MYFYLIMFFLQNIAVDLVSVNEETNLQKDFAKKLETVNSCNSN